MAATVSGLQSLGRAANLPSSTSFTFCAWVRVNGTGTVFSLESAGGADGLYLYFSAGVGHVGELAIYAGSTVLSGIAPSAGDRIFLAFCNSGSGAGNCTAYYRQDSANALISWSASGRSFTPATLYVGNDYGGFSLSGDLWNVKAWDRVLSADELLVESYYRRPVFPSSLNFWWPLDNHTDTKDYGGNGRDATVTGTLATAPSAGGLWMPRRRSILLPGSAPAPIGTLGQFHPELRLAAWF